jgi:hypothetical protein
MWWSGMDRRLTTIGEFHIGNTSAALSEVEEHIVRLDI